MVLTQQMAHWYYVFMGFLLAAVLRTPVMASRRARLRVSEPIEAEAVSIPLQSLFEFSSSESQPHHDANASDHMIRGPLPQPFHDILDVPPEERHLPDGMTIYDILMMPTMSEANMRRIAFSRVMPTHIPNITDDSNIELTEEESFRKVIKRQQSSYLRACPATSGWTQVSDGITVENDFVEVSPGQFFFKTTCFRNGGVCYGYPTPSTATEDALSRCTTLQSWVIAWAKERGEREFRWRHIALDTCCACAVKDRRASSLIGSHADKRRLP